MDAPGAGREVLRWRWMPHMRAERSSGGGGCPTCGQGGLEVAMDAPRAGREEISVLMMARRAEQEMPDAGRRARQRQGRQNQNQIKSVVNQSCGKSANIACMQGLLLAGVLLGVACTCEWRAHSQLGLRGPEPLRS